MEKSNSLRQILVAVVANFSSIGFGLVTGWSSPNVAKLQDERLTDTPLDRVITAREVGWIGSLVPIGGAISPIIAGTIANKFGRKLALLSTGVCLLVAYLILGIGTSIELIFVARLLHGISVGVTLTVLPVYLGEIAQDALRGSLVTLMLLFMNVGVLFSYCVGPFVPYATFQYASAIFPVVFLVLFAFMPETPVYYLMARHPEKAIKSLMFLRGRPANCVLTELGQTQRSIDMLQHKTGGSWLHLFTNRGNLRALIICCGLIMAQQFSGINAIVYYAETILERVGGNLPPEIASIMIVAVPALFCWAAPFVIARFDRKTNLLVSAIGMGTASILLCVFFALDEHCTSIAETITFLPIVSLIIYMVLYNIGAGPIPYVLVGEIFAPNIRTYASIIISTLSWVLAAIIVLFFEILDDAVGPKWVFAIFAICIASGAIFIYFIVIETKGFTLLQIQERLNKL